MSQTARVSSTYVDGRLHEAFLERASSHKGSDVGRHAFGGFLVMRLIDQVASSHLAQGSFSYQLNATRSFVNDLQPATVEVNHLRELIRISSAVGERADPKILRPALIAYGLWLEQQMFFADAVDVLDTTLRLGDEDAVQVHLQRARVLRLAGRFEDSREAYEYAGTLAKDLDDPHSEMLSRIGYAIVLQKVGNLQASERLLREVIADAERAEDREAEARASHDLAIALHLSGRTEHSIPLAFRAFQLYSLASQQARALVDTGVFLKTLNLNAAAKRAFDVVIDGNPTPELRARTQVELVEIAAIERDRISFERLRRELQASVLPPDEQVNYEIQVGIGLALFDRFEHAENHLTRAIALAEDYKLGERLFFAEEMLGHVRERRTPPGGDTARPHGTDLNLTSGVQDTIERLETLQVF